MKKTLVQGPIKIICSPPKSRETILQIKNHFGKFFEFLKRVIFLKYWFAQLSLLKIIVYFLTRF